MKNRFLDDINHHPYLSKIVAQEIIQHKETQKLVLNNTVLLNEHSAVLDDHTLMLVELTTDVSKLKADVSELKADVSEIKNMLTILINKN